MLMYICLPRLFYLGLRSGRLTGNFGQSPQSRVCVTVDKKDNRVLHLPRGAVALTMEGTLRIVQQAGLRPVLILSEDIFNERSGTIIAMAITSQPQRAGFQHITQHIRFIY